MTTAKERLDSSRISPALTGISGMLGAASFEVGALGIIFAGVLTYLLTKWGVYTIRKIEQEEER